MSSPAEAPTASTSSKQKLQQRQEPQPKTVVDYKSERDVVDAYTRLRQELSSLVDRISDVEVQASEHALVAKTMKPMDPGRRAYRLVGDVLVERTVGEVLPAVEQNLTQIEEVLKKLRADAELKDRELAAHVAKYKIRVSSGPEQQERGGGGGGGGGGVGQLQGVLV